MSRRRAAIKREVIADPQYNSILVTKFINVLMRDGKKSAAEKILYDSLSALEKRHNKPGLEIFEECIEAVKPEVEVRSRRVGGATYQVPMPVRPARAQALSLRWIIIAARKRNERTMTGRLTGEFNDILKGTGSAMKKREDTHRMAEANKAFSHFRW